MEYKETYEKFWSVGKDDQFDDYIRNRSLHLFFPPTTNHEKILDIAGGAGIVSEWLQKRGYDVTLVEFSDTAVSVAQKKGLHVLHQMIEGVGSLPIADNSVDSVFFGDIIEHLFDGESALREVYRILKPGGRIVVSCPNMAYWRFRTFYLFDGDLRRIDVVHQKPWEWEHIRFYTIGILKEFLVSLNFTFTRYVAVNEIWHSRFLVKYFPHLFGHTLIAEFKKSNS